MRDSYARHLAVTIPGAPESGQCAVLNVVISDYDTQVIADFGGSFVNHRRPERTLEESPSELIVGHLTNL